MVLAPLVKPGENVRLSRYDPDATMGWEKDRAKEKFAELSDEILELQELLFATKDTGLLLVFQGMDTAGKDGAINRLISYVNVQSVRVTGFKAPTPEELAHDFLWRVHRQAPGRGEVAIFNRSHYEDVLVVRVHELVPEAVWKKRYARINEFEKLLFDNGTIVLKFFLHITKKEQEERLLAREQDPVKAWKLAVKDWQEREHWDAYEKAYEDALSQCSTEVAPWHIVPANRKWFRDLAVAEAVAEALRPYRARWLEKLEAMGNQAKAELLEYRKSRA